MQCRFENVRCKCFKTSFPSQASASSTVHKKKETFVPTVTATKSVKKEKAEKDEKEVRAGKVVKTVKEKKEETTQRPGVHWPRCEHCGKRTPKSTVCEVCELPICGRCTGWA